LQLADPRELHGDIGGVRKHRDNSDDEPKIQAARRTMLCGGNFLHVKEDITLARVAPTRTRQSHLQPSCR